MNILTNINNTRESYQSIISFYERNKDEIFSDIHLELRNFFAANMSAALGAILDLFISNLNDIQFDHISSAVENILQRNEFLSYYGRTRIPDYHKTTIKFQKVKPTDGRYFKNYVTRELIDEHNTDLPRLSPELKENIVEAIYEIFVNAQIHSDTKFIYTCGQFYPQKNKIEFTIVDSGIGFKNRINRRFGKYLSAEQAIRWAIQDKMTTKQGISGGIGLAILKEFINANKGKMQIVSNDGFYQLSNNKEMTASFIGQFPGTIVNLQLRTDDQKSYSLKDEIDVNDIF